MFATSFAAVVVQILLIGVGAVVEALAVFAMRGGASRTNQLDSKSVEPEESGPKPELIAPVPSGPPERCKDYYEMEEVPEGVRPGELLKTAKVWYIQSFRVPRE